MNEPTDDIMTKYLESSICVLSSRYEGFSLVILESMACGVPVVSFDCPHGPRNIIKDGEDGLLIDYLNVNALADGICSLMKNDTMRKEMGKNARINVQRFSKECIMGKWIDLFQNFVSEQDLIISCEVIKEKFPEYYDDYVKILNDRYLYPYCMFVARKELVDEYCLWLFPLLQTLEDNLDVTDRKIGYFAELALALYAIHNKLKIKSYDIEFKNLEIGFYTDIDFPL